MNQRMIVVRLQNVSFFMSSTTYMYTCTHVVVHVLKVVFSHFAYSHFALQGDVIIVRIECCFITSTCII